MQEQLEIILKRIQELEKRLERYYEILEITNELDFILNGTYVVDEEIGKILEGNY